MNEQAFGLLKAEAADLRIGPRWLDEVRTACTEVARRFDPAVYAVAERMWSDSEIEDLIQDVTVEQLLHQGQLDYILDVAVTIDDVRRLLRFRVRRQLARRRRRTVVDRLLDRLTAILTGPGYESIPGTEPTRYTPSGSDADATQPTDEKLRRAAAAIRLLPTTPASGERAPAVYRSRVLAQVASRCFHITDSSLSIDDFGQILREALTSWLPEILELGDEQDWPADEISADADLEGIVNALIEMIPVADQEILYMKLSGSSDSELATQLDVSRPTAARRKVEAFDRLREAWATTADDVALEHMPRLAQEFYLHLCETKHQ